MCSIPQHTRDTLRAFSAHRIQPQPSLLRSHDGGHLVFTYIVDTSKTDVQLTPEITNSLDEPWIPATPVESAINGVLHTMKVVIPANNGKAFVRLRVVEL